MFKLNESVYDEVTEQLEKNLNKFAFDAKTVQDKKIIEALELLNSSAELLEQFGFTKEAEAITKLMILAAKKKKNKKDPSMSGLTSEKMLSNLAYKGTMFNADDQNMSNDHKLKSFPESLHGIPVIYLEKGDEDYNAYCPNCAKQLQDEGKNIHGHVYEEGPNRECKNCGKELESAMGQDAYYAENADPEDNIEDKIQVIENPDNHKREQLELGFDEYDDIMGDLDEAEDQVFI